MNPFIIIGLIISACATLFFTVNWMQSDNKCHGFIAFLLAITTLLFLFEGADEWDKQHRLARTTQTNQTNAPILQTPVDANRAK